LKLLEKTQLGFRKREKNFEEMNRNRTFEMIKRASGSPLWLATGALAATDLAGYLPVSNSTTDGLPQLMPENSNWE
jgi:hypothetical protein